MINIEKVFKGYFCFTSLMIIDDDSDRSILKEEVYNRIAGHIKKSRRYYTNFSSGSIEDYTDPDDFED